MIIRLKLKTDSLKAEKLTSSKSQKKGNFPGRVKKTTTINVPQKKVWNFISNIGGLPLWVKDVKTTTYLSKKRKGAGAIREITFTDKNKIEEHVVSWRDKEAFSYIAVSGLPLKAYVATLSAIPRTKNKTTVTWESYLYSEKMTKKQFCQFIEFMGKFYHESLQNLKRKLEK